MLSETFLSVKEIRAKLGDVEVARSDAGAEGRDHQPDFLGREHFVETRSLDV